MTDRFPLIANPTSNQIEELASGDNLNLQNSGIVGATTITATKFVGSLEGNATSADRLNDAAKITGGFISSDRLSGYYGINVNSANILTNAANITSGTISSERLNGGFYGIGVSFATIANNLTDARNITQGTINPARLEGTYDINVSSAATASALSPGTYNISILGNAGTATSLSGGVINGTSLSITGISTLASSGGITTTGGDLYIGGDLYANKTATIGYSTITSASIGVATVGFLTATNIRVSGSSTVGVLTASSISTPIARVGILTLTTLDGVVTAGITSLTSDYIKAIGITSLNYINTGIASVGIATIGFASITSAYIGITTVGFITANNAYIGITTVGFITANNAYIGIATVGFITANNAYIGVATLGFLTATSLNVSGVTTVGFLTATSLNVSGITTLGFLTATSLNVSGITTVGFLTATSLNVSGITTVGFITASSLNVSGITTLGVTTVSQLSSAGIVTGSFFSGSGINLVGIVTQLTVGTGITLTSSQALGKGTVQVGIKTSIGKTIYVSYLGSDANTGLIESDAKRTIKAAAALALPGDTIKVFPGTFVENNPITLAANVSIQGTELRNCTITPQNPGLDLFYVNNGCHMTNLNFNGSPATNNAAVISFVPLAGVSSNRFFDGARMIRLNLDFIANEAVGYVTSFLFYDIDPPPLYNSTFVANCVSSVKSALKAVCFDITRGGNSKCVGAGKSYYTDAGAFLPIPGGISGGDIFTSGTRQTMDAITYAAEIARSCINNVTYKNPDNENYQNYYTQVKDLSMQPDGAYGNQSLSGCANVTSAIYSCVGVVTTILKNGLSALGGAGINTTYPADYDGQTSNNWSSTKIGLTTYSPGVGNIDKGPYIRNCTNFIANSIGLKVNGFDAEPGDQTDIGVTGSMSVDSYTQYNQGGIGVSITNGGYAQLVSIFTICDDIAIYTSSGGQCDITNSNSSFGNYGLYSVGVGDNTSKSIYRYTGTATTEATARANVITISGVGTNRPYDGQSCYFGTLYYNINEIQVDGGGSGYTGQPTVTISDPTGPNGIAAQASATVVNGSVTAINVLNAGSQYLNAGATVTIAGPAGAGTTATASISNYQPIYYKVAAATLPSAGISTVTFLQTLNNTVSAGTTVYFARGSLQLASTISFEYVGAGTNIFTAKPALGGVVIPENKVIQIDGGTVTYTSTDQSGNFNIGDGVVINQSTGQISGRDFTKALFTTMTPFILALSD
jgi:hypothetical protein